MNKIETINERIEYIKNQLKLMGEMKESYTFGYYMKKSEKEMKDLLEIYEEIVQTGEPTDAIYDFTESTFKNYINTLTNCLLDSVENFYDISPDDKEKIKKLSSVELSEVLVNLSGEKACDDYTGDVKVCLNYGRYCKDGEITRFPKSDSENTQIGMVVENIAVAKEEANLIKITENIYAWKCDGNIRILETSPKKVGDLYVDNSTISLVDKNKKSRKLKLSN